MEFLIVEKHEADSMFSPITRVFEVEIKLDADKFKICVKLYIFSQIEYIEGLLV